MLRRGEGGLQSPTSQRKSIAGGISVLTVSSMVKAGGHGDPLRHSGAELQQLLAHWLESGKLTGRGGLGATRKRRVGPGSWAFPAVLGFGQERGLRPRHQQGYPCPGPIQREACDLAPVVLDCPLSAKA